MFARTRNICCGHKFCIWDTKNVSDFVQKHFVSATNVFQFAQPKKHHEQQWVCNNVSSFASTFTLFSGHYSGALQMCINTGFPCWALWISAKHFYEYLQCWKMYKPKTWRTFSQFLDFLHWMDFDLFFNAWQSKRSTFLIVLVTPIPIWFAIWIAIPRIPRWIKVRKDNINRVINWQWGVFSRVFYELFMLCILNGCHLGTWHYASFVRCDCVTLLCVTVLCVTVLSVTILYVIVEYVLVLCDSTVYDSTVFDITVCYSTVWQYCMRQYCIWQYVCDCTVFDSTVCYCNVWDNTMWQCCVWQYCVTVLCVTVLCVALLCDCTVL